LGSRAGSERVVHCPSGIVAQVVEDVSVAPECHCRVSMTKHLGNCVERNVLAECQGAHGMP
jgi:hypothetical protein